MVNLFSVTNFQFFFFVFFFSKGWEERDFKNLKVVDEQKKNGTRTSR